MEHTLTVDLSITVTCSLCGYTTHEAQSFVNHMVQEHNQDEEQVSEELVVKIYSQIDIWGECK